MQRIWQLVAVGVLLYAAAINNSLAAAELTFPVRVTVTVGESSRSNCPVSFQFDASLPATGTWRLVEVTSGNELPVPAQVDGPEHRRVCWLLSGSTAAGQSRHFEFRLEKPSPNEEITVDRHPDSLTLRSGQSNILCYHTAHVTPPKGIDKRFGRSAYIHPVWTPRGAIVTDEFPRDHAHQSGIFLAYTKAIFEGRPTNFWEIKEEKGRVRFKSVLETTSGPVFGGFRVEQEHVDLTVPGGKVALNETWDVRAWQSGGSKSGFWIFDVESTLTCATASPLHLPVYHYGGFAVRGASNWKPDVTTFLTQGKHTRVDANHTRSNWSDLSGPASNGEQSGIAVCTLPTNFRFPEPVRIHDKMPYFVYTPSPLGDWSIESGKPHVSRYRVIVHDDLLTAERLDQLWRDFAEPPQVSVVR